MNEIEFGELLKNARQEKGLSLKDVKDKTGITDSRLMRIENAEVTALKNLQESGDLIKLYNLPYTLILEAMNLCNIDLDLNKMSLLNENSKHKVKAYLEDLYKRDNCKHVFRLGELFSGPGGLGWGALNATIANPDYAIVHEWANDFDESTCETYRYNISSYNPRSVICHDVRTLDISSLGEIDALAFGFPCNDFSLVGEQKGFDGTYGPLYTYGIKALKEYHPQWFLAENVSGIQSANGGKAFIKILQDMKDCGYRLYPNLYYFEEYGVPQTRHRVIIVGIRNDLPYEFKVPSPVLYKGIDVSCKNAIENPPIPKDAFNNERAKQSPSVVARLAHIKPGQNAFTANIPEELQLKVKGAKISQIYKRLDPSKPAYTITGSGGGGTHVYHWDEPRSLTNRERARIQTFPDSFKFIGSKENVRKQIGMAVPCKGAKIIFEAILNTFAGIPYESVECNIKC